MAALVFALLLGPGLESASASLAPAPTYSATVANNSGETVYLAVIKKWGAAGGSDSWRLIGWSTLTTGETHTVRSTSSQAFYYAQAEDGGHWDGDEDGSRISMSVHSSRLNDCEEASGSRYDADSGQRRVIGERVYDVQMGRITVTGDSHTMKFNP